jgi:hypothetical protein
MGTQALYTLSRIAMHPFVMCSGGLKFHVLAASDGDKLKVKGCGRCHRVIGVGDGLGDEQAGVHACKNSPKRKLCPAFFTGALKVTTSLPNIYEVGGIAIVRQRALDEAYARHPERFSKGRPVVKMPPAEVSINPVPADADQATIEKGVNFPTLQRVIGNTT